MTKHLKLLIIWGIGLFCLTAYGQKTKIEDKYKKAESFLKTHVENMVYNSWVSPNWTQNNTRFWYETKSRKGYQYYIVEAKTGKKKPLFDHEVLTDELSRLLDTTLLPFRHKLYQLSYDEKKLNMTFFFSGKKYVYDIRRKKLEEIDLTKKEVDNTAQSPDKNWSIRLFNHNLFLKNNKTGKEKQLTTNGQKYNGYGENLSWYETANESEGEDNQMELNIIWSPDSKYLLIPRYNYQQVKKLYMYKASPEKGYRAEIISYLRPLAGDSIVPTVTYYIAHLESGKTIKIDMEPVPTFQEWGHKWKYQNKKIIFSQFTRGYKMARLIEADVATGETRKLMAETFATYFDPYFLMYRLLEKQEKIIWASEKDGWNHLYMYDYKTGKQITQITKGQFVVRSIEHVDEKSNKIYFTASGVDKERDPYLKHLYVVDFDGENMKLLTPEDGEHHITFSTDGKYLVDNFSRYDKPNVAVLRRSKDGKKIKEVETMDMQDLVKAGWKAPELFKVKAKDGETDIYGLIYKPNDFDPSRKYPVIDGTYSGPHTIRTPKTIMRTIINNDLPLAQLGFVVVTVDGVGSAYRSKKFHDYSYKNLSSGIDDHVVAIRQLARKYSFMDIEKVGIYGHSAGGYDAVHALLKYPNFYKVGVSSAGNHDHRIAKAWWPELYMGYPLGEHYNKQSNFNLAKNLKGKILLVHGQVDQNVNPASSIRMADEFIKENKDFDLILVPGCDHGTLYYNNYFIRKRWDYFVEHLLDVKPPKEYKIK